MPTAQSARAIGIRRTEMPFTIFNINGTPATRRERIEAAVVAGGKRMSAPHEGWNAN